MYCKLTMRQNERKRERERECSHLMFLSSRCCNFIAFKRWMDRYLDDGDATSHETD